jgi:hypothetical protein
LSRTATAADPWPGVTDDDKPLIGWSIAVRPEFAYLADCDAVRPPTEAEKARYAARAACSTCGGTRVVSPEPFCGCGEPEHPCPDCTGPRPASPAPVVADVPAAGPEPDDRELARRYYAAPVAAGEPLSLGSGDEAMAKFQAAHDAQDAAEAGPATAVIPVAEAETQTVQAVTEGDR